jgi:hypothetical protein
MPTYTFDLRDGDAPVEDPFGAKLPDREQAFWYAQDVARELMKGREPETRFWRLDVYEDRAARIFQIPFASVDWTLDHLPSELREAMEIVYDKQRSLRETLHEVRATLRESRALVALSRGRPYLATDFGKKVIRDAEVAEDI